MTFTPFQNNYWYIGWKKQSAQGTPAVPDKFWRWLDGTSAGPKRKANAEWEGDASPFENLVTSASQYYEIKVKEYARPITMGCALQAVNATGSDTYTGPTYSSTLAADVLAGATTVKLTADAGNTGTLAINIGGGYPGTSYEVLTIDCTTRTTPNYTYTIAASGTAKKAHTNGATVTSTSQHVFTRQAAAYDFYTIEYGFTMPGSSPKSFRIQDCVCYQLKISGQKGSKITLEHDWYGIQSATPASQASPTYEGYGQAGVTGGPFMYYQNNGTIQIDGANTGNAATVTDFALTIKNSTAAEALQSELFLPSGFLPGTVTYDLGANLHFQNYSQFGETYLGSTTVNTSSTDSYLTGMGSFSATFNTDAVNAIALSMPNAAYLAADIAPPKLDGQPVVQPITFKPTKQSGTVPATLTLTNSQNSQY